MEPCSNEQLEKIVELIKLTQKNFRDRAHTKFKECGFTLPQLSVISILNSTPNINLNELSEKLGLSKSTVSGLVERLENHGVVIREIPEDNHRMVRLSLSKRFVDKDSNIIDSKSTFINEILKSRIISFADSEKIIFALEKLISLFVCSRKNSGKD